MRTKKEHTASIGRNAFRLMPATYPRALVGSRMSPVSLTMSSFRNRIHSQHAPWGGACEESGQNGAELVTTQAGTDAGCSGQWRGTSEYMFSKLQIEQRFIVDCQLQRVEAA